MYRKFLKPTFNWVVAFFALIILSPLFLLVALAIKLDSKGPVFFIQQRIGKRGRVFKIFKFRSMVVNKCEDKDNKLYENDPRLTRVGIFIRKTSVDELPQLINVLKGDMSLIGPRPLLVKYLPLYSLEQAQRHKVCPGITGWAQVTGRNSLSWEEKFKRDVWYVDNFSFALDMKIFWLTLIKVFKREGINQQGQTTMEPFIGNTKSVTNNNL